MKHLRLTLLSIGVLLVGVAHAQSYRLRGATDTGLGSETHSLKLAAGGSFLMNTYGVTSATGGLTSRLPMTLGFGAHTDGSWHDEGALAGMWWNLSWMTVNYAAAGFTPTTVRETKWALSLGSSLYLGKDSETEWLRRWALLLGYGARVRNGELTTPNVAISGRTEHGLILGSSFDTKFNEDWGLDTRLLLFVPVYSYEYPSSGLRKFGMGLEYRAFVEYVITGTFSVAVGLDLRFDFTAYKGEGSRGTVNASENDLNVGIPLEFRFGF